MEGPITARGIARRHHFFKKEERTPTIIGKTGYKTPHPTKGWRRTSYKRAAAPRQSWWGTIVDALTRSRRRA